MFDSLLKSVIGISILPVAVAADIITLGGELIDKQKPFTQECSESIAENLRDVVK